MIFQEEKAKIGARPIPPPPLSGNYCLSTNTAYIDCFTGNFGSTCGEAFSDLSVFG
jgi:hypothetical protein